MESDDGLELNDEEQRQQQAGRQHRASVGRRVAWATFALIVVGALAGLFGPGPLSWADRTSIEFWQFVYP